MLLPTLKAGGRGRALMSTRQIPCAQPRWPKKLWIPAFFSRPWTPFLTSFLSLLRHRVHLSAKIVLKKRDNSANDICDRLNPFQEHDVDFSHSRKQNNIAACLKILMSKFWVSPSILGTEHIQTPAQIQEIAGVKSDVTPMNLCLQVVHMYM